MTLVVSKMYVIKSTKKSLYYGNFNKHKHKTNIIYFTEEEESKKIAKYVSNYYFENKKAPKIEEIDLDTLNPKQNYTQTDYFTSQKVDEKYFKFMINNNCIDMCQCNIKNNKIHLNYIENEEPLYISNVKINLKILYDKSNNEKL